MAYAAGTAGERQVFIQPYPDASAGKWQVSGTGGEDPRWRGDGRELFFVDAERRVNVVDVLLSPRVEIGVPKPLGIQVSSRVEGQSYDVAPDGRRFVVLRRRGEATGGSKLIVTVDWQRPERSAVSRSRVP